MRNLREQDFDHMATRVVDRFMGGEKLADVAALEAQGSQLNPDQVERLTQAANTMAFLRLMEQQKTQGQQDMTHEFDPIDARQVIEQIMHNAPMPGQPGQSDMSGGMPPGMPGGDDGPLPNEMDGPQPPPFAKKKDGDGDGKTDDDGDHDDDDNDGPFPKGSKDKKSAKPKAPPVAAKKDDVKEAAFRTNRQRKLAGILEDQYRQAEWSFEEDFTKLSMCLKQAHGAPTLEAFEKDALALHGDEMSVVVLNMVRAERDFQPMTCEDAYAKHAALADRHIVEDSAAIKTFERLVKIATEAARLKGGAEWLRIQCS